MQREGETGILGGPSVAVADVAHCNARGMMVCTETTQYFGWSLPALLVAMEGCTVTLLCVVSACGTFSCHANLTRLSSVSKQRTRQGGCSRPALLVLVKGGKVAVLFVVVSACAYER